MRSTRTVVATALAGLATLVAAAPSAAATPGLLRAGAGQADITPPQTGYYLGGWTRADRLALGQSTRLYANTLVLQRGTRKVALVAAEVFAIPAGLQEDVARAVSDLGYDKTTVLLAASHTHSGPGGFANNPTYNTAAPSPATVSDPASFAEFFSPLPADPTLYTFLVKQIAASIRRADGDRAAAAAGWARTTLTGLTQNRSIEAHLADHGIHVATGSGSASMDPLGVDDTIDPEVDVLRVDKLVRRGRRTVHVPIGAYSNFADHGTVVHSESQVYSGDHHAAAWRVFVDKVRKASPAVPRTQTVVNVYPNGDEGDQTAGIRHVGIAAARMVGSVEAGKMFDAWKAAGRTLSRTPALDVRWTRSCFCGRATATGNVASKGAEGLGFLTGSEEGRGPLYDLTHVSLEGNKNPIVDPVQGDKYAIPVGDPPPAVPLSLVRIGDGVLVAVPGEPTKQVGTRLRAAVLAPLAGSGVTHAVIAGLADDYIQYITTPEEYGEQSYEGASTLFGRSEATFLQERYTELATQLASGAPATPAYALDPSYGVKPDGPAYPAGAASGSLTGQPPASVARGGDVRITWSGAPLGRDRPVDKAFVLAQRQVRGRWRTVDSDLGLHMLWHVTDKGAYDLTWSPPTSVPAGTYRLMVTAQRYALTTRTFVLG
ncbi:neutral/alkaline non-lysosomal ceramidase N-terminal domain-containing protein [Paraconexibacter antarcticus]|uniref:Neutral ceramidase n=1 Tax=Paraconexibacter antarcticus TaxID=2949664 RepID=A0ABY5DUN6_9ACTN|nr:neutral/alkaline non-lysosomal ceramidase N-terminal domain-containing protein [Paraconexibacter antarcticus]UTI65008.1 neutral/alkaline non-lysosomal ceramidase N-terminal domain-containing protein [Paraconexibacter antarcticus]